MHSLKQKQTLYQSWVKSVFKAQPIQDIRNYFGESYALLFAYMGYACYYLVIAAVVGVPCFIAG